MCSSDPAVLAIDPANCGYCGNACGDGMACVDSQCVEGGCQPGEVGACYDGQDGTVGIGPCAKGTHTCDNTGNWSRCTGEVVPVQEACGDSVDNNCNGTVDEDVDADHDGYTNCAGDCCDSTECGTPSLVNPGAFDAAGNGVDDDCNGVLDDTPLLCDQGIASNTTAATDFAKAIDICQTATETDRRWGVISGSLTLTNGTGTADPRGYSVRPKFGTNLQPMGGVALAVLSTGAAAAKSDQNPAYNGSETYTHTGGSAPFPADFLTANGGQLPNAPGCPDADGNSANDPEMLTLRVRVPTNAKSFKLSSNFYSYEFPEYTCSKYNDFYVVLLDSAYQGATPNPVDKNLAFYTPMGTMDKVPVGVNLGHGNTGLFTQCKNGQTGCSGTVTGSITTCLAVDQLAGTGFDNPGFECDSGQLQGGATGWLTTTGNVVPGEIITLRIAIWDTSDHALDSTAVIDGFQWSTELSNPGTVIGRVEN